MKVAFDLQLDEAPLFIEAGERLLDHGAEVVGVTLGKRWSHLPRKFESLDSLGYYIDLPHEEQLKEIRRIEEKYHISLNKLISLDRYAKKLDYRLANNIAIALASFYEQLFVRHGVEIFYGPGIAFLTHYLCYYIAKKYNAKYVEIKTTRIPNDRFVTCGDNDEDEWDLVTAAYNEKLSTNAKPSQRSIDFVKAFREKPFNPGYMALYYQKRSFQLVHARKVLERFKFYYGYKWGKEKLDYYTQHPLYYIKRDAKVIIKSRLLKHPFERPVPGEEFVLFPLHFQPEATTYVQAPFYDEQISTIHYISKCIPRGMKLYVKEHKSSIGTWEKYFYKRILEIPNVRLIHPGENTYWLMLNAKYIVNITSTVGWEAILFGRRPVVLGKVFYNSSGLSTVVKNYEELAEFFLSPENPYTAEEQFLRCALYLDALYEGTYDAKFDVPGLDPSVMEQSNLERFARSILADIEKRGIKNESINSYPGVQCVKDNHAMPELPCKTVRR